MDNLTHSLIGLAASKAGLEKLSPGTTALCILAANAPDGDIVSGVFGGRWVYLQHHRGITHSIVGTVALALFLPLIFYLFDRILARVRNRPTSVKLQGLLLASILVSATHPFMDWTNNYGVRFLLPWSSRWFYGDFVFIIDPFLWLILGGAIFLVTSSTRKQIVAWLIVALVPTYLVFFAPSNRIGVANATWIRIIWIMVLIAFVILFKQQIGRRWGTKIPITALVVVAFYLGSLSFIHAIVLRQARFEALRIAAENGEQAVDVAAMPTLANPFQWLCVLETERAAYRFHLSLTDNNSDHRNAVRYEKPEALNPQILAQASNHYSSRVFLGFARFPVARLEGEDCVTQTLVQFADLRYTEPGQNRGTFSLQVPVVCPIVDNRNE